MWPLMDGKHIVSVPHHDGLLVDMVDDGLYEAINGMAADCNAVEEVTLVALDMATREVKR